MIKNDLFSPKGILIEKHVLFSLLGLLPELGLRIEIITILYYTLIHNG